MKQTAKTVGACRRKGSPTGLPLALITGASGFVGSRLANFVAQSKAVITVGTYLTNERVRLENVSYYQLDVVDRLWVKNLIDSIRPNIVVHIAGTKDISFCAQQPEMARKVHALGTENVVEACSDIGARLLYVSTDCVFDGEKALYVEGDPTCPFNTYGKVKLEAENIVLRSQLQAAVIRMSLAYGWHLPGQASNTVSDVIQNLENHQEIRLPNTLFNTPVFIGDAVSAIFAAALLPLEGVFHLAGRERLSRYELGIAAAKVFGLDSELIQLTDSSTGLRPRNSCLNPSKLEKALGMRFHDASTGLKMMWSEKRVPVEITVSGKRHDCEKRIFSSPGEEKARFDRQL